MYSVNLFWKENLIESKFFQTRKKALQQKKLWLVKYLVGYGIIYDDMTEKKHRILLSNQSLDSLENIANEAYCNKELDYLITIKQDSFK